VPEPDALHVLVADFDDALGAQRTNDRSLPVFQRLNSEARGVRAPPPAAQAHGWSSNVVTSDWSSVNSSLRRAAGTLR
jgi:hypothetical protein